MTQVPSGGERRGSEATCAESHPAPRPLTNHRAPKSPALAAGCGEACPGLSARSRTG